SAQNDRAQGHDILARQKLTEALRLNPDFVRGLNASADLALQMGRLSQAEGFPRRVLSLPPNHPLPRLHLDHLCRLKKAPVAENQELQICVTDLVGTRELQDYEPLLRQEMQLL